MRDYAIGAEKAIIARLLLDPEQMDKASSLLPEDFSHLRYSQAYESMRKRYEGGKPFDAVTVHSDTGVDIDVMELSPAAFAPVEEYVNAIKDASLRRGIVRELNVAISKIRSDEDDPVSVVAAAVGKIVESRPDSGLRGASEVIRSYSDEFRRRGTPKDGGITYGIPLLDGALLPMRAGRLVVFASRPGIGKTALAESVSDHAAHYAPVLFVSLEMGAEELTDRAMARASGIKAGKIMRGEIKIEELDEHLKARSDLPITYLDEGMTTTADILSAAHRVKMANDGKLGLIIVDYLQLVADKGSGDNEVYRVGNIAHALKRMALKLKVPVLALAQLNRSLEYEGRAPRLSDLRDSGAIEQDADVVVIITGSVMDEGRDLFILKQRAGHTGKVSLMFDGDTQRWSERPKGEW